MDKGSRCATFLSFFAPQLDSQVGVGVMFQQRPDNVVVVKNLIPGGPAERSGNVRIGDLVQRVSASGSIPFGDLCLIIFFRLGLLIRSS